MPYVRSVLSKPVPVLLIGAVVALAVLASSSSGDPAAAQQATATPVPSRVEDTDPKVTYGGTWDTVGDSHASGGQYHRSTTANSTATYTFFGSFITWIYRTGPDGGLAGVTVDGQPQADVDQFAVTETFGVEKTYGGLAGDAQHTIVIQVRGRSSQPTPTTGQATNAYVSVDAFVATVPPPAPSATPTPVPLRFEDTDTALQYAGGWATVPDSRASGGTYHQANAADAVASFTFRGPEITWVHSVGPNRGIARVLIDGTSQGTVDLYAPNEQYQQSTTYSNLAPTGDHTIRIEVTGTQSGPATGNLVDVDAFIVRDAPVRPQPTPIGAATPAPTATSIPPGPTPTIAPAPTAVRDARYFHETEYRIDHDPFWSYFNARGGVDTFGFPTSRTFPFLGCTTHFFQRQLLQQCGSGQPVRTMNLLDPDLMPYNQINFSTFPAHDPNVASQAPAPNTPNYGEAVLAHVRRVAPETFEGMPVRFYSTFNTTVPTSEGDPDIRALLNLEIWGFPTSNPAADPTNHNFVYQRFQRGILHYDHTNRVTRGILLSDYFKSIITGRDLPLDLATQAAGSRFFQQYCPGNPRWVCRPDQLEGTDLTFAFERQ